MQSSPENFGYQLVEKEVHPVCSVGDHKKFLRVLRHCLCSQKMTSRIFSVQIPSDYTRRDGNEKILGEPSEGLDYSVSQRVKLTFKVLVKIVINLERAKEKSLPIKNDFSLVPKLPSLEFLMLLQSAVSCTSACTSTIPLF